jgi:hypothetical protein
VGVFGRYGGDDCHLVDDDVVVDHQLSDGLVETLVGASACRERGLKVPVRIG